MSPTPRWFWQFAFSFAFNLRNQNVTDFSFIYLTQNFLLCHYISTARHCTFLHIVPTVAYQTMVAHQCLLPLPRPLLDI